MAVINQNLPATGNTTKYAVVDFRPNDFDVMIEKQGVRVRVYKTLLCPNYKRIDSNEHQLNCPICFGKNFIDKDPIESWATINNQSDLKKFEVTGTYDDETVAATFKREVELFYFAKVELLDFTTIHNELIQRQEGEVDRLKYASSKVTFLIDSHGVEYLQGSNFELDTNGDIKWTGTKPVKGTIYSVYYDYPVTFRTVNAQHINRFVQVGNKTPNRQAVQMPQQWSLKKDLLILRKDIEDSPLFKNRILEV